jgi:hypothetical protein
MRTRDPMETERSEASAPAATLLPILAQSCPSAGAASTPTRRLRFVAFMTQSGPRAAGLPAARWEAPGARNQYQVDPSNVGRVRRVPTMGFLRRRPTKDKNTSRLGARGAEESCAKLSTRIAPKTRESSDGRETGQIETMPPPSVTPLVLAPYGTALGATPRRRPSVPPVGLKSFLHVPVGDVSS